MRLARIRSSNPAQVEKLRRELRSAGYVVEVLGLSAASPWKADLELLVEANSRRSDSADPEYRIFLNTEAFGPVHRSVAEALQRVDSAELFHMEASQPGLSRARYAVLTFSAAIILIALVLGFLIWSSTPSKAPGAPGEAESFAAGSPWVAGHAPKRSVAPRDRSAELASKPLLPKPRRHAEYREPEVVVTHFTTGLHQGSRPIKKFSDLK